MELFVAPTIGFDLLYAFIIVRLARRDLVWINVTPHPAADWIARQITEAFTWNEAPCYLIRDRDRVYGAAVMHRLRAMGIRDKPIAPRSPWENGFAERLIGSIRREYVDHVVALGEAHLRRILQAYAGYYNDVRTHRSLDKDAPFSRPVQRIGRVTSHALLGGLHHRYCRILIIAVGFNWAGYGFGWPLRGTAEQKAKDAGEAAIVRVLAPICADKFRQASDSSFRYTQRPRCGPHDGSKSPQGSKPRARFSASVGVFQRALALTARASGISRMKNSFRSGSSSARIKVVPGEICDIVDLLEARERSRTNWNKGQRRLWLKLA